MSRNRPKTDAMTLYRVGRRDGWECHICHDGEAPGDPWELDHVRSVLHNGPETMSNYALAHRSCNRIKGKDSFI